MSRVKQTNDMAKRMGDMNGLNNREDSFTMEDLRILGGAKGAEIKVRKWEKFCEDVRE